MDVNCRGAHADTNCMGDDEVGAGVHVNCTDEGVVCAQLGDCVAWAGVDVVPMYGGTSGL